MQLYLKWEDFLLFAYDEINSIEGLAPFYHVTWHLLLSIVDDIFIPLSLYIIIFLVEYRMAEDGRIKACLKSSAVRRFIALLGIGTSGAVIAVAILTLLPSIDVKSVIVCIYQIIFGILLLAAEFKLRFVLFWFYFLAPHIGLGLMYFFTGVYTVADTSHVFNVVVAIACLVIGVLNIAYGIFGFQRIDDETVAQSNSVATKYSDTRTTEAVPAQAKANNSAANAALSASAHLEEGTGGYNANPFESQSNYTSAYN